MTRRFAIILLALLCLLMLACLNRAPALYGPQAIQVRLAPGQSLLLGREELAAPQADLHHLLLRRDAAGRWWLRNASAGKQLLAEGADGERRIGSSTPAAGQQLQAGAARFEVTAAASGTISLAGAGSRWQYDGAHLLRDGARQPRCPGASWLSTLAARPLAFGGNLHCGNRIGVDGLAPGSVIVRRENGRLVLAGDAEESLDGISAITIGHTRMRISTDGATLALRPLRHVALYPQPAVRLPAQLAWEWQRRPLWNLPGGSAWTFALILCALFAAAAAFNWQRGAWPFARGTGRGVHLACAAAALLVAAGLAALLLQRAGTPPGAGWSILLGCAALWCCLMLPGRLALATAAGVLLLAIGLLAQLEQGLGALESSSLRHFQKTAALLAIGLGAGALLRLYAARRAEPLPQARLEWALALFACAALCALLLQVAFGDETGVFDLQPVELAKLALAALSAHCLAVGLGWHAGVASHVHPARRWFRLAAPALLFAALLGLALVQVDDYSPLILLLVWAASMAAAWSLAARRPAALAALLLAGCTGVAAIAFLREAGAGQMAQLGFYADRFMVWLDPAGHPHTGQQLLLAARAIAEGAWWGADNALGLSSLGQPAGAVLAIPAVQDDFAPSFFLNRHGLLAGLALWTLQALFLCGVLACAARSFAASAHARDFRHAWQARFHCFALCGGAAFVLGHFLLSWGTNLAMFPVMGQPMSFLSAGGSHLLFFICPLLALSAISAQSLEENASCRSMSNTKS